MPSAAVALVYDAGYRPSCDHLPGVDKSRYIVPPSPLERRRRMQQLRRLRLQAARNNYSAFMQYVFVDPKSLQPFHQQWFHDEWGVAMDGSARLIIVAPRDHGKTSQIVGRVLYELGRNPNLRIKIVCASDGRAKERLFEIKQHIKENERLHEVFPDLKQDEGAEWSKHKIVVLRTAPHRDASVEALGITSTATGGRADLLISDDAVDRRNALSFPALRKQIKQAWKSDWTNLLEPDGRIFYICTLWHKDDLSHELMENPEFDVLAYAVDERFGSLWPEKWPTSALKKRHSEIGSVEFNRGFRNQAVDLESTLIDPTWFIFSNLQEDEEFKSRLKYMVFLTSYDTASSPTGKKDQDYSAGCPIAIDVEKKKVYVLDAWHCRETVARMAELVWEEYQRYEPFRILIEKVGQAVLDEWVLNAHPDLDGIVQTTHPKISKELRLMAVTPLLEHGQVIFSHHLNPHDPAFEAGRGNIYDELTDFPFGKWKDMVDAFSQALKTAREYFLDWDANGGENIVEINIGGSGQEDNDGYIFN